ASSACLADSRPWSSAPLSPACTRNSSSCCSASTMSCRKSATDSTSVKLIPMTLSDLAIKNPVFAVMLSAAMVVFGYLGYRDMGVSQFPEIDFPVVSIAITREAASPDIMDGDVTDIVEDAVAGVEGVDYIMSQSLEGTSIVTVYFRLSRSIDVAMQDVQNAVSAAR